MLEKMLRNIKDSILKVALGDRYKFGRAMANIAQRTIDMDINDYVRSLELTRLALINEIALQYNNEIMYGIRLDRQMDAIPYLVSDKNGQPLYTSLDDKYECDLSKGNVVTFPWDVDRAKLAYINIAARGFHYDSMNHKICYFPQLDMYYTHNGFHSIGAGMIARDGVVPCGDVYDITQLFETASCDGVFWKDISENRLAKITDFRFALIFEISKRIWLMKTSTGR